MNTKKRIAIDWLTGMIATIAFLALSGWMGAEQVEDQLLSAQVLAEIENSGKSTMLNPPAEMAELDARARYMTSYERIALVEGK